MKLILSNYVLLAFIIIRSILILTRLTDFLKCRLRISFRRMGPIYVGFRTYYEADIKQLCSCIIHKYNILVLLGLIDFVESRRSISFWSVVSPLLHVNATLCFFKNPFLFTSIPSSVPFNLIVACF